MRRLARFRRAPHHRHPIVVTCPRCTAGAVSGESGDVLSSFG